MSQNMYGKEKPVGPRFYWNLTPSISVYFRSNIKLHAGLSIFLCHLSENECFKQVSENFKNGKIFRRQNFFVGNNFRLYYLSVNIFITRKKIRHFLPTKLLLIRYLQR